MSPVHQPGRARRSARAAVPTHGQRNLSLAPDAAGATVPKAGDRRQLAFVLDRAKMKVDQDRRTIEVSFSSEEPVARYWGNEILDHEKKSVDLTRLKKAGPVLMEHDRRDQVGVVEEVWLDDKVGRARLRFSKSARAQEVWADIVDGIRSNVSVSYSIDKVVRESEDAGVATYRVQRWCPEEISIVSVPADTSVGVGRSEPDPATSTKTTTAPLAMNRARLLAALKRAGITHAANATDEELSQLLEGALDNTAGTRAADDAGGGTAVATAPARRATRAAAAPADDGGDDEPAPARSAVNLKAERNRMGDIMKLYREHNCEEIDPDGAVLDEYLNKDFSADRFGRWIAENRYAVKPLGLDPSVHQDPRALPENQRRDGQDPTPGQNNRALPTSRDGALLLGNLLVNSEAYRNLWGKNGQIKGNKRGLILDLPGFLSRATLTTGSLTSYERPPGIVTLEQQPLMVADIFAQGQTTREVIRFLRETAFTNAATAVAEEGLKPEATFSLAEADAPVEKIAVIGRVTDEMFADFPEVRDYVNNRLRYMQQAKEEDLLLNGTGSTPQITGLLNTTDVQTFDATSAATVADALHRAMTKIRVIGFFEPDYFVMNPYDWEYIALAKDSNGQYYGGGPFGGAYGVGGFTVAGRVWGKPVVTTTALAQGTAIAGSFKLGAQVWRREGIRLDTTNSDGDDFKYNRIAIRVEGRMALSVYRPLAFCTITSIPAL